MLILYNSGLRHSSMVPLAHWLGTTGLECYCEVEVRILEQGVKRPSI